MALTRSAAADKNIVDRTRAHRNSEAARTVRRVRERLAEQAGSAVFDRELLRLHAGALLSAAPALALLVVATAVGAWLAGAGSAALLWGAATLLVQGVVAALALRVERADAAAEHAPGLRRLFLLGQLAVGGAWGAALFMLQDAPVLAGARVVEGAALLLGMSAAALAAWALRAAVAATWALPSAAFVTIAARSGRAEELAMAALIVLALPLVGHVARQKRQAAVAILSFRSEKDGLIAELETAKGMSDEARRRAEEANLAKSRFLASMSHELRTPLNAILGFSEVMAGEVLGPMHNPAYRDYARDIHHSGKHLLDLINEILDLSRIEAGRHQLNEEPMALAAVVEDCCRMMELKARNKDLRIVEQFERDLPRLFADERAVRQIALNLLSNAVKFAPSGSEIVVRVGWTAGGGQYLSVRDHGPGIPADEIPVVLSAFGQGSIAIKSAEQGAGLGLPIVQQLLSVHGGSFELHSRLREGTEAVASFPAARVMEELPALPTAARARRR